MNQLIELVSKYGEKNSLKLMKKPDGSESKTYLLKSTYPYMRTGIDDSRRKFIHPMGGPVITVGERLVDADAVVKSIDHVIGKGYIITFE